MSWRGRLARFATCASLVACGAKHAPAVGHGPLGGEVARVGDVAIAGDVVASVAAARAQPVPQALEAVVEDALLAQAARARGIADQPGTRGALASALAARALSAIALDARAQGAPTDAERSRLNVVHALVRRSPNLTLARAEELAAEIRRAVGSATTPEAFEERALTVPHAGVRLVVERVGPFDAGGRLPDSSVVDRRFVAASFALRSATETSAVTETPFGWHVIRLVERLPPATVDDGGDLGADGGVDLDADVLELRARIALVRLLDARRDVAHVELAEGVESLLARARAEPDPPVSP
jgi:hypothetical protein